MDVDVDVGQLLVLTLKETHSIMIHYQSDFKLKLINMAPINYV